MTQKSINRSLKDKMLDHVDHALGRPENPLVETYRNHYSASAVEADAFRDSRYWEEVTVGNEQYPVFVVTETGRKALASYLLMEQAQENLGTIQDVCADWCVGVFGFELHNDLEQRCDRFVEEALELVQALGYEREDVELIIDHVFNRKPGEVAQEIGGTIVTFACLVDAAGYSMRECAHIEIDRIRDPEVIQRIKEKQAAKPPRRRKL